MRIRTLLVLASLLIAAGAWAAAPPAMHYEGMPSGERGAIPAAATKALGDPTDFLASFLAGADYLVYMQSDIFEDNAGNGDPDADPQDGGWDWVLTPFEHSANASSNNLYGVTAQGLYRAYQLDPKLTYFRAMKDAADDIVIEGPTQIRSGPDVTFLLDFANLGDCPDPAYYRAGAQAIWDRQLTTYGTLQALAEYIRDVRFGQGYSNGIIPWDISAWVEAAMAMHDAFPAGGHDVEAANIAEVIYQDSFMGNPGYFDVYGANMGSAPGWDNILYQWYTIGLSGIIDAFELAGVHTGELAGLETVLLDCQYADGGFSDQYGATSGIDRDWQTSGYALISLVNHLPSTAATQDAIYRGAQWMAATQDVSGGWVYGSGNHYPEVGGEATAGMALAWTVVGADVTAAVTGPDPAPCGTTKTITYTYEPEVGTPGLRGYEMVLEVTGPVDAIVALDDFDELTGLSSIGDPTVFYVVDEGAGVYSVNGSILGTTVGLQAVGDLFSLELTTNGDGVVDVTVLSYRMRDPDNVDMFATMPGVSFTVDCTAPPGVTDLTSAPGHEKVTLDWTMVDASDVDHYEVWRAVWNLGAGFELVSAYPEYDDDNVNEPVWPADHAAAVASLEWVQLTTVPDPLPGTAVGYVDGYAPRGIYYYEIYAVDAAGNIGPGAGPLNRATNYWLGDIDPPTTYDGDVDVLDIDELGATFGYIHGVGGYEHEADVGPTDDVSSFGIPETDNVIDFEDLMIFAMNYGNVAPRQPAGGTIAAVLAWVRLDDTTWALELVEPCANLKGLRLRAGLPDGVACEVSAGELLDAQASPVFVANIDRNGLDANLALMGRDCALAGDGELLRVTFSANVEIMPDISARRADNGDVRVTMDPNTGSQIPGRFGSAPSYPNPFNPKTTIAFDLPESRTVRLSVYSIDGSLVRTLIDGELPAGSHTAVWDGLDDARQGVASGAYFYRIEAGPDSAVYKMLLMK
jgi:hypothetical protein